MPQKSRSKVEMLQIKKRAKALLMEYRLTQKEIGAQLGVTEKNNDRMGEKIWLEIIV